MAWLTMGSELMFAGKVAIVTGASRGRGKAIAIELAWARAAAAVAARMVQPGKARYQELSTTRCRKLKKGWESNSSEM